ncbi:hypothetical protein [Burkholderia pseudomallei]|uniref:hypothetical protein n=1 Tax=Burkholderia pseudomallei TaxID=28450 RepID=UPI0011C239E5|nr:hypothetical protein [Burkholderia pseudomallei]
MRAKQNNELQKPFSQLRQVGFVDTWRGRSKLRKAAAMQSITTFVVQAQEFLLRQEAVSDSVNVLPD